MSFENKASCFKCSLMYFCTLSHKAFEHFLFWEKRRLVFQRKLIPWFKLIQTESSVSLLLAV